MICPNCGATIPDGSKFCTVCGARLADEPAAVSAPEANPASAPAATVPCPVCGAPNPADAANCVFCGSPMAAAPQPAPQAAPVQAPVNPAGSQAADLSQPGIWKEVSEQPAPQPAAPQVNMNQPNGWGAVPPQAAPQQPPFPSAPQGTLNQPGTWSEIPQPAPQQMQAQRPAAPMYGQPNPQIQPSFGAMPANLKQFVLAYGDDTTKKSMNTYTIILYVLAALNVLVAIINEQLPLDGILLAALAVWYQRTYSYKCAVVMLVYAGLSVILGLLTEGTITGIVIVVVAAALFSTTSKAQKAFENFKQTGQPM